MNLFADFAQKIRSAVQASDFKTEDGTPISFQPADMASIVAEPPRDADHGDVASNAAMVLAKKLKRKPRDIATRLAAELVGDPDIETAEVAGPGFLNLRLTRSYWSKALAAVLNAGIAYGRSDVGNGRAINVEYVSANPTGPLHVGHCRGAVFGDALAALLEFAGYDVTREYYINDAGQQVDTLARSAYLRYREALGEGIGPIPEGYYPGDYLKPVGEALVDAHGDGLKEKPEAEWLPIVRDFTIDAMMAMIRDDLKALNVNQDVFFSERSLSDPADNRVDGALTYLRDNGLIYEGVLPPPKGQLPDDWEDREQTLFRATEFGDDIDRALLKSDGSYTYFASDIAYHYDKYRRGFADMIDVWGADHGGYVKRMQAAVKAITGGEGALDVKLCQLVKLYRGGEAVTMSKRAGTMVTLRDVVDEVGRDPVRFMMLYRKNDAALDFDFQKVTEQSRDNPVFYVQYGHARAQSVFRQAAEDMPNLDCSIDALKKADLDSLTDRGEAAILARLVQWPRIVESAAQAHEPHRLAFYLFDLASDLHAQWSRGKEDPRLRFIKADDPQSTLARLALVRATALVIASGLDILGVSAPDAMH
ncbi:MAG: arginine--tRNA ligase [Pseudomonadota bacterium]